MVNKWLWGGGLMLQIGAQWLVIDQLMLLNW